MLDIAKIAEKNKIKNIIVSNGFINREPLEKISDYIDAGNIDLKSMDNEFYEKTCSGRVDPVLDSLKTLKKKRVWIEITNLLIPGLNDSDSHIRKLASWVLDNLGSEIPLHFTGFFPNYKLTHISSSSAEKLRKARKISLDLGLKFVYTGNLPDREGRNTYCPECREVVIERQGIFVKNNLNKGICTCGFKMPGLWEK
jgi:pyruvate formate lyase activating enzyme